MFIDMVQLNLNLKVAHVCANVARYISNDTRDLLLSTCCYFLQYIPCKDNIAHQVLSSTANCMPSTLEYSCPSCACICQTTLKYSQILVTFSSIYTGIIFLNTQCLVKVFSCTIVKKLYSIILLFCLRASYLGNYILGTSNTFGFFYFGVM